MVSIYLTNVSTIRTVRRCHYSISDQKFVVLYVHTVHTYLDMIHRGGGIVHTSYRTKGTVVVFWSDQIVDQGVYIFTQIQSSHWLDKGGIREKVWR